MHQSQGQTSAARAAISLPAAESVHQPGTRPMTRADLVRIIDETGGLDRAAMTAVARRWQQLCKPLHSLGLLEDTVSLLGGIQSTASPHLDRCGVFVFCADNGVVAEGVTQTGQAVTGTVTRNFTKGLTTLNAFARATGADVFPVDVGVADFGPCDGVLDAKVRSGGTDSIMRGPAMTEPEALRAMRVGIERAEWAAGQGYDVCVAGEMGIGNTTTSAAVISCLMNEDPADVTGRGAGLDSAGLQNKIRVIRKALMVNRPEPADPIDVLAKVGGLDIAAMAGFYIGCARYRIPVLLDGVISLAAALIAVRIDPLAAYYIIATHEPEEPGAAYVLRALEKKGFVRVNLANGEGTGGLLVLPVIRMGLKAFQELATFDEGEVEAYQPLH